MTAQLIYIFLSTLGLGISIANHGKPRSEENSVITFVASIVAYSLLYWGGFFDVFFN